MKKLLLALMFLIGPASLHAMNAGDQGYGIMVGNPSGLSGKMWFNDRVALDGAFGVDQSKLDAHVSLLFHDFELLKSLNIQQSSSRLQVPVYMGVGPRILFADKAEFGIRTPLGISFFPERTEWEVFTELAPVIRLSPSVGLDFDFALGCRYYFWAIRPKQ